MFKWLEHWILRMAVWTLAGGYFAIAAISGSIIPAFATFFCGWFAAKAVYTKDTGVA